MNDPHFRPLPPDPLPASLPNPADDRLIVDERPPVLTGLKVYSHSSLVYWWPVWVAGYLMAGLSRWRGVQVQIGADSEWFHPSNNLGVCFLMVLILVIVITNVSVRGLASGLVIAGIGFFTVLLAYLDWWDQIFTWLGDLKIHLNEGAYFWFSTLLLVIWGLAVFVFDRMSYWSFKPGQVTQIHSFGAGSKSYDTNGMLLEKHREDLFRHWLLGFGSGDLRISTTGATKEQIEVPNILFIGSKIKTMQRLISEEPNV